MKQPSPTALASLLLALSIVLKLAATAWLAHHDPARAHYTYLGDDHPHEWPAARAPPAVRQAAQHSARYSLDTPSGTAEWRAALPGGDGLVYLGAHRRPFTLATVHQLRCLDVLRAELVRGLPADADADAEPSALARHCLNYVRQMVLCRGDTHLEPYQHPNHIDPIVTDKVYECRDWSVVFDKIKENQAEYARWRDGLDA